MSRPKDVDRVSLARIAPNTVVVWFKGLTMHTGRVVANLPGLNGRAGSVVVKATDGTRHTVSTTKVFVKTDTSPPTPRG